MPIVLRRFLHTIRRTTRRSVVVLLGVFTVALLIWGVYLRFALGYKWADWTGLENKTVWDWMELFLIPIALALAAYWLNSQDKRIDREIANENRQAQILQAYLDYIGELIFQRELIDLLPQAEQADVSPVVKVAKAKTVLALRQLNRERREAVFRFLKDTGLYGHMFVKVDLENADLQVAQLYDVDLRNTNLAHANLSCAQLRRANMMNTHLPLADLSYANFSNARMQKAYLYKANLEGAFLREANLEEATLEEANLVNADLRQASLNKANLRHAILIGAKLDGTSMDEADLTGAIMPNGKVHD